jgi:broad specificity phosphatase PhoE
MIKLYIARHGETTWNMEGKIQGRSDPPLSPKGYTQSIALSKQLKDQPLSAIYTSTLQRSILTALPIAEHLCLHIQKQPELDELSFGILEGKQLLILDGEIKMELERFKESRLTYRISGGENYIDVAKRLRPLMERILQKHEGQEILIVGHRIVNRLLIGMLLEYPFEEALKIEQTNDCLYLINRDVEAMVFHYMNGEAKKGLLLEGEKGI